MDRSTSAAPMQDARSNHTAVTLQDGRVLVAGGTTSGGGITSAAEIYDPASNSWTPVAGGMTAPRSNHTASLLADGTVLIAGGQSTSGVLNSSGNFRSRHGRVYGSCRTCFLQPASLTPRRYFRTARCSLSADPTAQTRLASSDLFDPESGLINPGPALSTPRQGLSATTTIDGKVLVAGGNNGTIDLASAEIFQAGAGFSATAAMATARSGHLAFLLPNNNGVLIVGGSSAGAPLASAELFYPWTGTFNTTGAMTSARTAAAGAALKQDGVPAGCRRLGRNQPAGQHRAIRLCHGQDGQGRLRAGRDRHHHRLGLAAGRNRHADVSGVAEFGYSSAANCCRGHKRQHCQYSVFSGQLTTSRSCSI